MGLLTTMTICKNCGNRIEGRKDIIFLGSIIAIIVFVTQLYLTFKYYQMNNIKEELIMSGNILFSIILGLIINEVLYHLDNRCCYSPE